MKHCLERGWDFCSEYHVSRLHQDVWPRVPARDRVGDPAATEGERVVEGPPPRGRSGAPLIPRTPMERGVLDLFPTVPDGAEPVAHRETLSADPCVSWCECVKLQESCEPQVMNAMDVVEKKKWAAKAQKYPSHLASMTAMRDQVAVVETDNMADVVLSQGGTTIANLVRYQYKVGKVGRRYSSPLGAQRCSNLVRGHVLPPATEDFDMVNAMTNLVVQAVRKVDLSSWLLYASWAAGPSMPTTPRRSVDGCRVSWARRRRRSSWASPTGVPSATLNTRNPRVGWGRCPWRQGCRVGLRAPNWVSFTTGSSRPRSPAPRIPPSPIGGRPLRTGYSCAWRRSRGQAPPATSRAISTAPW